jgi:hypothetical protein
MLFENEYCGKKGKLAIAKEKFEASDKKSIDYADYALICYEAANCIFADIFHLRRSGLRRWKKGVALAKQAVGLCDKIPVQTIRYFFDLNNQAVMLDIICLVYFKYGFLCGGRKDKILFQIIPEIEDILLNCSLNKNAENYVSSYMQVFLHLHQINSSGKKLKFSSPIFSRIRMLLLQTYKKNEVEQAGLISLRLSKIFSDRSHRRRFKSAAFKLANDAKKIKNKELA